MDDILDRVAGSMALEGFELTEDDRRRIQTLIEHPELKEQLLQELVKKHTDKQGDMAMEELYIQFDQECDTIMCWWPGSLTVEQWDLLCSKYSLDRCFEG